MTDPYVPTSPSKAGPHRGRPLGRVMPAARAGLVGLVAACTAAGLALATGGFSSAESLSAFGSGAPSATAPGTTGPVETSVAAVTSTTAKSGPLRLYIAGDSTAGGLGAALQPLADASGLETTIDYKVSSGLTRDDFYSWPDRLREQIPQVQPGIVVVMFGGNDAQPIALPDGRKVNVDNPDWATEYGRRVGETMDYLSADGRKLVWVGVPSANAPGFNARLTILRDVLLEQASTRTQVTFVDTWPLFNGPDGTYADYVVDESDRLAKKMRAQDGYHLNPAGAKRLARLVMESLADEVQEETGTRPQIPTTTPAPDGAVGLYDVQPGDFWGRIAERLGVSVTRLLEVNGATPETYLYVGEKVKVPLPQ
jgi:hypothetical protein